MNHSWLHTSFPLVNPIDWLLILFRWKANEVSLTRKQFVTQSPCNACCNSDTSSLREDTSATINHSTDYGYQFPPVNFTRSLMQIFSLGNTPLYVCCCWSVLYNSWKKGLSELIWCCLSACWGYPGWAVRKARILLWLFIVMGWILSGEIYRASPQHIQLWGRCEPWHQCGKEFSVWQAVNTGSDGLLPLMPLVLMRETVWNELLSLFPSLLSTVSAGDCPPSKNKTIGHLYKHLIMTCVYVLNLNTLQNIVRAQKCVLVPSPWDLEAC